MKIHMNELRRRAPDRPRGYIEDCVSHGTVNGDWLELSDEQFDYLRRKYSADLPGPVEMLRNFGLAVLAWLDAGFPVTDKHKFQGRMAECLKCLEWVDHRCRRCGCYAVKQWLDTEACPIGKW